MAASWLALPAQHLIVNYNSVKMVIFKLHRRLLRSDPHWSMLTQTDDGCLKVIILFIIFDHLSLWESCNHYTKISWTQNISYHYIENIWNQFPRLRVWPDEKSSEEIYSWMFVDLDSAIKSLLDWLVLAWSPLRTDCPRETYIWSLCGPDVAKINSIQIRRTNFIFEWITVWKFFLKLSNLTSVCA